MRIREFFLGQEAVTFEPGSKLRELESDAFANCDFLKRLRIPGSVEKMTGASLPDIAKSKSRIQIHISSGTDIL
jgi:hypothetical protein